MLLPYLQLNCLNIELEENFTKFLIRNNESIILIHKSEIFVEKSILFTKFGITNNF